MIKLTTFAELVEALENNHELYGAIVFSSKGWKEKEGGYSLKESTFVFSGEEKAFGDYAGYSCFASDLAGIDQCIRLEQYWDKWERKACFVLNKEGIDELKDMIEKGMIA